VIVVDCSAVIDALTATDGAAALRALLAAEQLHAPDLIDYEVVSALRAMTRRGALSVNRARDTLTDFEDLPIERWPSVDPLRRRAFELRDALSAYDAAYVALAEVLNSRLVTRDERLARSSGHTATIVVPA
jgi:predicted nucleic acid-binding protein